MSSADRPQTQTGVVQAVVVNEALTRRNAELARLDLTDAEVQLFTGQLKEILGYIEQLASVGVDGVEPLAQPFALQTPLREDVVRLGEDVLKDAPDLQDSGFKVPPILV